MSDLPRGGLDVPQPFDPMPTRMEPWWVKPGLAAMGYIIFAGAFIEVCRLGEPTLIGAMAGVAGMLASNPQNFYFGSSSGSRAAQETISKIASGAPPPPAPEAQR